MLKIYLLHVSWVYGKYLLYFPAYGDGLPSSLRLGSSYEEKKVRRRRLFIEKASSCETRPPKLGRHWIATRTDWAVGEDVAHGWDS